MPYFLGIVREKDFRNGRISPSFVLVAAPGSADAGIVEYNSLSLADRKKKKILFHYPYGNEKIIDYLSCARVAIKRHSNYKKRDSILLKGYLFYFSCNRKGKETGKAIFVKRIPSKKMTDPQITLSEAMKPDPRKTMTELLCGEPHVEALEESNVKPHFIQTKNKKETLK